MFKPLQIIPLTAILIFGATGCSPGNEPAPEVSQTTEAQLPSAEKSAIAVIEEKLSLKDENTFTENNFLVTADDERFIIDAYGTLETAAIEEGGETLKPAEGEVFHAINYTYKAGNDAKVTLEIAGVTKPITEKLGAGGTLIVSAPQNTEIILHLEKLGITQTIDFKQAQRTSPGIAEVWYRTTEGTLTNPKVTEDFVIQDKTVKLTYSVTSAERTAYSPNHQLADNGKSAWVIIKGKSPQWAIPDNGGTDNVTQKFTLKDSTGKEYALTETPNQNAGTDDMHMEFKVPSNIDSFALKLDSSTDIVYFGENQGTAALTSEKVLINFTTDTPTFAPTPGASGTQSAKPTNTATSTATPQPTVTESGN